MARAIAQMIEGGVVRDTEQPTLRIFNRPIRLPRHDRLDEDVLDDIVAVDGRADHARAVAMQPRAHIGEELVEFLVLHHTSSNSGSGPRRNP